MAIAIDDVVAIVAASIANEEDDCKVSLFSVLSCIKEGVLPIIRVVFAIRVDCVEASDDDSCRDANVDELITIGRWMPPLLDKDTRLVARRAAVAME